MGDSEKSPENGKWGTLEVLEKLAIPIGILLATLLFDCTEKKRENDEKSFEIAVGILQSGNHDSIPGMEAWALKTFRKVTGTSESVAKEVERVGLPSTPQLVLPNPNQLRVSIIRRIGSDTSASNSIMRVLLAGGYTSVTLGEADSTKFPRSSEVRYYYPADSENALALNNYIVRTLRLQSKVNDRSTDVDARTHGIGALHVYVRP